ncbi:hypothetical protein HKD37_04G011169 [Glycine soja]
MQMNEDQWIYDNIMFEEVNMNEDNGDEPSVFENIDCFGAFNTSQVFATRDDVLHWVRSIAYDIGFVAEHNATNCTTMKQIVVEFECVNCAGIDSSHWGCIMRTTFNLLCACELARYAIGSIPLDTIHMFWRRLSFSNQGLSEPEVTITKEMVAISKRFEELDICGKAASSSFEQPKPKRKMPMLDQFHPCIHDFIENIVDVKADGYHR